MCIRDMSIGTARPLLNFTKGIAVPLSVLYCLRFTIQILQRRSFRISGSRSGRTPEMCIRDSKSGVYFGCGKISKLQQQLTKSMPDTPVVAVIPHGKYSCQLLPLKWGWKRERKWERHRCPHPETLLPTAVSSAGSRV